MKSIKMRLPCPGDQGNHILIGLSFSNGCNTAFLVLVNSGFREKWRLKDAIKDSDAIALSDDRFVDTSGRRALARQGLWMVPRHYRRSGNPEP